MGGENPRCKSSFAQQERVLWFYQSHHLGYLLYPSEQSKHQQEHQLNKAKMIQGSALHWLVPTGQGEGTNSIFVSILLPVELYKGDTETAEEEDDSQSQPLT